MKQGWKRKSLRLLLGALGMALLFASAGQAQVIHPDQMIGSSAPHMEAPPEGGITSDEATAIDLEKGFDRALTVPEGGSPGTMDMKLKAPDAADAENARESDSRSAVSF